MESTRKRRSFMTELLVWILLLVVVPLGAISAYLYRHETAGMSRIEQEKSLQTNSAAEKSISRLGETILGVTITNGYWEANRQAVLTRDDEWLKVNISDMPGVVPNVDFVAEADLEGRVLVQAGDVKELQGKVQIADLLQRFRTEPTFTGIVDTSKGAAVIAVSQVTGDKGDGPAVGMLITGRLLTDEILQGIDDTLQSSVALLLRSGQYLSSDKAVTEAEVRPALEHILSGGGTQFKLDRLGDTFIARTSAPYRDLGGHQIGVVYTRTPSVSMTQAADGLRSIGAYSIGIMALLLALIVYLLRQRIVLPLRHFTATLEEVAAGRQVQRIPERIWQAEAQIVQAILQIMEWNQTLERTVRQRTAAIRSLLDNARQGFLTIGPELLVDEENSVEAQRILGGDPAGCDFVSVLYPEDEKERELLRTILAEYFAESDSLKKELIFSLLEQEVEVNGRRALVEYKPITGGDGAVQRETLMIMLTDLTETRRLERQMEQERQTLQAVVQVVTHSDDFAQLVRGYEAFLEHDWPELEARIDLPADRKLGELLKCLHTFKGNFAYLKLRNTAARLHELETLVQQALENGPPPDAASFAAGLGLDRVMEEDSALLHDVLGDTYDSLLGAEPAIALTAEQWRETERLLEQVLTAEAEGRKLLDELRKLRYRPFKSLIKHYPSYLQELAERKGNGLHPVKLEGGDELVDPERFRDFARTLVHVIRNIVEHAIESPDERVLQGKDEYGTVRIAVDTVGRHVRLTVSDDGRGIDTGALLRKAAELGIVQVADDGEGDAALQLVFRERVSTALHVSEEAGRGVGLSAVKQAVDEIGGSIELMSEPGAGTTFVFWLPIEDEERKEDDRDDR